jgi:hypothetical protein
VLTDNPNRFRGCQHASVAALPTYDVRDYLAPFQGTKKALEKVDVAKEKAANIASIRKLLKKT